MMIMQAREEKTVSTGNPALSLWLHEDYAPLPSSEARGISSDPEQVESSLAAYELAIELAPREAILYYHKGKVLEQLGRRLEAAQAFKEARELGLSGLQHEHEKPAISAHSSE